MKKQFNPLFFLASLGAGWISITPFAFMQYSVPHGAWLVSLADIIALNLNTGQWIFYGILFAIMWIFAVIHFIMTIAFLKKLFTWKKTDEAKTYLDDPLKNAGIVTPLLSLAMTMNVFIGSIRFFIPWFSAHLQDVMLPALIVWLILVLVSVITVVKLLKKSFEKWFDVEKINFGWLLYPFALGMVAVVWAGMAALAHTVWIANTAAFFAFMVGTMWFFLFSVKLITIFKKHFASKEGLGEKQFLPSFLIVLPNVTLYALIAFRLTHYMGHQLEISVVGASFAIVVGAFAFSSWYLIFGLSLLKDYFKKHFVKKEFYVTQWGLICPFVAYAVLGSFMYQQFFGNKIVYVIVLISMLVAIWLYFLVLIRQLRCASNAKKKIVCS